MVGQFICLLWRSLFTPEGRHLDIKAEKKSAASADSHAGWAGIDAG